MADISVEIKTQEISNDFDIGTWRVKITAGLDEEPKVIMEEALKRINSVIQALPQGKRYPRCRSFETNIALNQ